MNNNCEGYRRYWWQYGEKRVEPYSAIAGRERVLVIPQTSNLQALAFLPATLVFAHTLIVFPITNYAGFAVLQSRFNQVWPAFVGRR